MNTELITLVLMIEFWLPDDRADLQEFTFRGVSLKEGEGNKRKFVSQNLADCYSPK